MTKLSNNHVGLWRIVFPVNSSSPGTPNYYYLFHKDGLCEYYYQSRNRNFYEYYSEDQRFEKTWSATNTSIDIRGSKYSYRMKGKDTALLTDKSNSVTTLINSGLNLK